MFTPIDSELTESLNAILQSAEIHCTSTEVTYHPVAAPIYMKFAISDVIFEKSFSGGCFQLYSCQRIYHLSVVQTINHPSDCKIFTIEPIFSPSSPKRTLLFLKYRSRQAVEISSQALSLGWRVYKWIRPKLAPTVYKIPVADEQSTHLFTIVFLQKYACIQILSRLALIT